MQDFFRLTQRARRRIVIRKKPFLFQEFAGKGNTGALKVCQTVIFDFDGEELGSIHELYFSRLFTARENFMFLFYHASEKFQGRILNFSEIIFGWFRNREERKRFLRQWEFWLGRGEFSNRWFCLFLRFQPRAQNRNCFCRLWWFSHLYFTTFQQKFQGRI